MNAPADGHASNPSPKRIARCDGVHAIEAADEARVGPIFIGEVTFKRSVEEDPNVVQDGGGKGVCGRSVEQTSEQSRTLGPSAGVSPSGLARGPGLDWSPCTFVTGR